MMAVKQTVRAATAASFHIPVSGSSGSSVTGYASQKKDPVAMTDSFHVSDA
jgi:hypothetical protein